MERCLERIGEDGAEEEVEKGLDGAWPRPFILRVSDVRKSSSPDRRRSGNCLGSGDLARALHLDFEGLA